MMLTDSEIYSALTELFRDIFVRDDLNLHSELTAQDVLGWDSFKQIEIIVAAEARFGIRIDTRDVNNLRNVGELVRLIARKAA